MLEGLMSWCHLQDIYQRHNLTRKWKQFNLPLQNGWATFIMAQRVDCLDCLGKLENTLPKLVNLIAVRGWVVSPNKLLERAAAGILDQSIKGSILCKAAMKANHHLTKTV